jgi:hypothetical protein
LVKKIVGGHLVKKIILLRHLVKKVFGQIILLRQLVKSFYFATTVGQKKFFTLYYLLQQLVKNINFTTTVGYYVSSSNSKLMRQFQFRQRLKTCMSVPQLLNLCLSSANYEITLHMSVPPIINSHYMRQFFVIYACTIYVTIRIAYYHVLGLGLGHMIYACTMYVLSA